MSASDSNDMDKALDTYGGSGNVFRDFDDPDADLKQAKAILAARIIGILDDRKLAASKAAAMTGFAEIDFSRLRNADLGRFTLDRLFKMLSALDDDIEVSLQFASRAKGQGPKPDRREPART